MTIASSIWQGMIIVHIKFRLVYREQIDIMLILVSGAIHILLFVGDNQFSIQHAIIKTYKRAIVKELKTGHTTK